MLYGFLLIVHIIISILLVIVILMQASKGGGLAGLGGGLGGPGGSQMLGGRQAATLLHKVTVGLALVFGINALLLGGLSRTSSEPQSVTLEAISQDAENPLEFLGEPGLDPTEQQLEEARRNLPQAGEQAGEGETEQQVEEPVEPNE